MAYYSASPGALLRRRHVFNPSRLRIILPRQAHSPDIPGGTKTKKGAVGLSWGDLARRFRERVFSCLARRIPPDIRGVTKKGAVWLS